MEFLGKDRSVDPGMLTNREKAVLVESLRSAHRLGALLDAAGMAKSSCLYQKNALLRPDKHAALRIRITEMFHGSDRRYGYRRVHAALKSEEVVVSEKVVCRIMEEEGLIAKRPQQAQVQLLQRRDRRGAREHSKARFPRRWPESSLAHRHHRIPHPRRQGLLKPHN